MHELALGGAAAHILGTAAAHIHGAAAAQVHGAAAAHILAAEDILRTKCPGTKSPDPHAVELVLELQAEVEWHQPHLCQTEGVHPTYEIVQYGEKTHKIEKQYKNQLNLYYPGTAGTAAVAFPAGLALELGSLC